MPVVREVLLACGILRDAWVGLVLRVAVLNSPLGIGVVRVLAVGDGLEADTVPLPLLARAIVALSSGSVLGAVDLGGQSAVRLLVPPLGASTVKGKLLAVADGHELVSNGKLSGGFIPPKLLLRVIDGELVETTAASAASERQGCSRLIRRN